MKKIYINIHFDASVIFILHFFYYYSYSEMHVLMYVCIVCNIYFIYLFLVKTFAIIRNRVN